MNQQGKSEGGQESGRSRGRGGRRGRRRRRGSGSRPDGRKTEKRTQAPAEPQAPAAGGDRPPAREPAQNERQDQRQDQRQGRRPPRDRRQSAMGARQRHQTGRRSDASGKPAVRQDAGDRDDSRRKLRTEQGARKPERQHRPQRKLLLEGSDLGGRYLFTVRSESGPPLRFSVFFGSRNWDPLKDEIPSSLAPAPHVKTVQLNQIHGDRMHLIGSITYAGTFPREGDALVTRVRGLALAVTTADCVPLLMADDRGTLAAAVHAGWRGVAAGLPGLVVTRIAEALQVQPGNLWAFLGPSICRKCYRVGEEVIQAVARAMPEGGIEGLVEHREDGDHLDLEGSVRRQLTAAGLDEKRILGGLPCTSCREDILYSHRASGGSAGRMPSLIYLHPAMGDEAEAESAGRRTAEPEADDAVDERAPDRGGQRP